MVSLAGRTGRINGVLFVNTVCAVTYGRYLSTVFKLLTKTFRLLRALL